MKINLLIIVGIVSFAFATNIEIVGGVKNNKIHIQIESFTDDSGEITKELKSDFSTTGEFALQDGGFKVLGSITKNTNQDKIHYKLVDEKNTVLLDQTANFSNALLRKAVHNIANNIYKKITNTDGIFNSKIAVAAQQAVNKYQLVVSDYDGYNPAVIATTKNPISSIAWDKTSTYISYVSYETNKPIVYVQNISSGNRYVVANFHGSNSSPVFSPDGKALLITVSDGNGSQIISVPNQKFIQTTPQALIKFGTISTEADISFNGKVVFVSDHDGGPQLFMTNMSGAAPNRITYNLGNYNTTPRFSNDGNKIVFISKNNGALQTYIIDLLNQTTTVVTNDTHHDVSPSFSPNNKLLLISSDDKIFISNLNGSVQTPINAHYMSVIDQRWSNS